MVVVSFLEDLTWCRGVCAQNGGPAGWVRAGVGYALSRVRSASRCDVVVVVVEGSQGVSNGGG